MRSEKALIAMLNNLVRLLSDEAGRNPDFAGRLDLLLRPLQHEKVSPRTSEKWDKTEIPDLYAEFGARGESEFRLWLRDQPMTVLYALIRHHDLDATRRSAKWKDPEKLAALIADQVRLRLARGSAFLSGRETQKPEHE